MIVLLSEDENKAKRVSPFFFTIPNKKTIARAAIMDSPAPERDASVKSLGIFLKINTKSHSAQVYNCQSNYPNIQQ